MFEISPSFLNAKDLKSFIYQLEDYNKNSKAKQKIKYIHVDIMDNEFVNGTGVEISSIKQIRNKGFLADVHLMVEEPKDYIDKAIELGANIITIHLEIPNFIENLKYLKEQSFYAKHKILIGISIKPDTDVAELIPYIYDLDLVLVMSVEPGMGGQEYISSITDKIKKTKKIITDKLGENECIIEVDGGINDVTSKLALKNGANMLVIGSYLTNNENKEDLVSKIIKIK